MKFEEFFELGMKRNPGALLGRQSPELDVGGNTIVPDSPFNRARGWRAEEEWLSVVESETIGTIHCYHFLEHLPGASAERMLREFERVLRPGGVANIVVPYYNTTLQAQDLDHRSAWCEDTWKTVFGNRYYGDHGAWRLRVRFNLIAGLNQRNLALLTQLEKF